MTLPQFLKDHGPAILVDVIEATGSTPREEGTWMLVGSHAIYGTIGGGALEFTAMEGARALLMSDEQEQRLTLPLGPDLGQCCGGHVKLRLRRLNRRLQGEVLERDRAARHDMPHIYIFGAGHVGRALAAHMALMPVRTLLVDTRAEELSLATREVEHHLTPLPESLVSTAPPKSAYVILTHDHALDFLITAQALLRGDACYVGMIGSRTKKIRFDRWFADETVGSSAIEHLICPLAPDYRLDKRPEIIAGFVLAEIMAQVVGASIPAYAEG